MKYFLIIVLAFSYSFSNGQRYLDQIERTFSSSGEAILRIQPDQIILNLGVENRGKELNATKDNNYQIINKVLKYCKEAGILEKYIQTDFIHISPYFSYSNDIKIDYYSVEQNLTIVLEDISIYEKLITDLINIGINKVNKIDFRTTQFKTYKTQVLKMAIDAAKENAKYLTNQVGIQLGNIINIGENVYYPEKSFTHNNYANTSQNISSNEDLSEFPTLSKGMITIKANITLTYKIKE